MFIKKINEKIKKGEIFFAVNFDPSGNYFNIEDGLLI